ncbi:MAG: hypothetical protein Q8M18_01530, partial [Bradyrhizobium sp.]|nr:hypothetical protein [Bradyrhizobium sp.]
AGNTTFGTLTTTGITGDVGDVTVTSDTAAILGTTLAANGSAVLTAATTNSGTTSTATNGSLTFLAGGLIDWATLNAGTTISVRSTADAVNIGTATSGGSQTIRAAQDVTFGTLTTSGITGDVGDVTVTSDTAAIQGTTVAANGSATLTAATNNIGDTLTATTGDAILRAGGLIRWNTVNAGGTISAVSTGDSVRLGTTLSGGSQFVQAFNDIIFDRLEAAGTATDRGNIVLRAINGRVQGTQILARGDVGLAARTDIAMDLLQGDSVSLSTPQDISIGLLNVFRSITLAADTMNVVAVQLPSTPPVPLTVSVTGFNGAVATFANLNIDPPMILMNQYQVVDSILVVDTPRLIIVSGYVPGQLALYTPAGYILLDNRTPAPVGNSNLQLYQPGGVFSMSQIGATNFSNTQVVWYDQSIASVITNYGGGDFGGTSFVRNSLGDMRGSGGFDPANMQWSGLATFYLLGLPGLGFRDGFPRLIEVLGDGPAVNLKGLESRAPGKRGKKLRATVLPDPGALRLALGPQ